MRVTILGAGGMLGHDLVAFAPREAVLFPTSHSELDVTDYGAVAAHINQVRPDLVINAAAYTAVDRAESERELALRVNCDAVQELGEIARRARVKVVHFS